MKLNLNPPNNRASRFTMRSALAVVIVSLMVTLSTGTTATAATADSTLPTAAVSLSIRAAQASALRSVTVQASTGQYEYQCIGANGSGYWLKAGQKTMDCKGSFLKKYINGKLAKTYRLAIGGGVAKPQPPWTTGCVIAVASGVALFVYPPTGAVAWVVVGGPTAAGLYVSCRA